MRKTILLLVGILLSFGIQSQSLVGAWEATTTSENGEKIKNVVVFSNGYQVSTWFNLKTGAFIKTNGGAWSLDGNKITETIEFDTNEPERVGTDINFKIKLEDDDLTIVGNDLQWHRIDSGKPGKLSGAWLMSGRKRNGEVQSRDTNRPRKTMKMLSGTRFQWIAYNTETKQFMGTGGGTYTTENGKYTENIEFFSRDNSRVGMSLEFDFELIDGNWHHSGLSSKGQPIYEIWSLRK